MAHDDDLTVAQNALGVAGQRHRLHVAGDGSLGLADGERAVLLAAQELLDLVLSGGGVRVDRTQTGTV